MSADTKTLALDPTKYRNALSLWATGVAIASTGEEGDESAITINSFSSLSLDPPLVLLSVSRGSHWLSRVMVYESFSVGVLANSQADVARYFSNPNRWLDPARLRGYFSGTITGAPRLADSVMAVGCSLERLIEAGDHVGVIGRVKDVTSNPELDPLVFFQSRLGELIPVAS